MITIKSKREIELMRNTGKLAAETLAYLGEKVVPGVTTEDIDKMAYEYMTKNGAIPATLNYKGYPASCCTSFNHVICHGIPTPKLKLESGDILNIDVTTILEGYHGDTNRTFYVGEVKPEVKRLVKTTYRSMMAGIEEVKPGARLGNIGAAIQAVAEPEGYSVVRDFCGHGIGRNFHEDPQVSHVGRRGAGVMIKPGMTFTVEPMINEGSPDGIILEDGWTAVTKDGKWSAQFEHTILVTEESYEILTPWPDGGEGLLD